MSCIRKCPENCVNCSYTDPDLCFSCNSNYGVTKDNKCAICEDPNCFDCSGKRERCQKCKSAFGFKDVEEIKCDEAGAGMALADHPCTACKIPNCQ
jgi:hypothetical protein